MHWLAGVFNMGGAAVANYVSISSESVSAVRRFSMDRMYAIPLPEGGSACAMFAGDRSYLNETAARARTVGYHKEVICLHAGGFLGHLLDARAKRRTSDCGRIRRMISRAENRVFPSVVDRYGKLCLGRRSRPGRGGEPSSMRRTGKSALVAGILEMKTSHLAELAGARDRLQGKHAPPASR